VRGDSPLAKHDVGNGVCPFPATRVAVIRTHADVGVELWFFDAEGQALSFESYETADAAREHAKRCFEWETLEWKRIPKSARDPFAHAMAAHHNAQSPMRPIAIWARLRTLLHRAA
jgi:hypothetical protein